MLTVIISRCASRCNGWMASHIPPNVPLIAVTQAGGVVTVHGYLKCPSTPPQSAYALPAGPDTVRRSIPCQKPTGPRQP
jgi:hypothetical protein